MQKHSYYILYFLLLLTSSLWAGENMESDEWTNTQYNTTEGTEFWLTFMRNSGSSEQDNKDMFLYVYATSRENAKVTISNPRRYGSSLTFNVRAGMQDSCLIPNDWAYIEKDKEVSNFGIKVTSTKPIALYITNQHSSGKYDATNVLPTTALMGEYVVQTYRIDQYSTEFAIVATKRQNVTIHLKKTTINIQEYEKNGNVVVESTSEETLSINMMPGQTYLYRSASDDGGGSANRATSLSGTTICSNEPVALFVGGQSAKIPSDPENHIFSQAYPTDKWGKTFYVTPTYGMVYDYVQFTACKNNTQIRRNGNLIATIDARENYIDTIKSEVFYDSPADLIAGKITYIPNVVHYTTSEVAECFLYGTSNTANHPSLEGSEITTATTSYGAPVLTPIIPQELAMRSTMFATFTKTNTKLHHYINIVTPTAEVSGMRLDGKNISSEFKPIQGTNYSYAQKEISNTAHLLENVRGRENSTFTARIYGLGQSSSSKESYAYAIGSRVNRKADMLVNGQYIKEKTICITQDLTFKGLVEGDYISVDWDFNDYEGTTTGSDFEKTHKFSDAGDYLVEFIVKRPYPYICTRGYPAYEYVLDHVSVLIHVKDKYEANFYRKICEGDSVVLTGRDENGVMQEYVYKSNIEETKHFYTIHGCDSIISVKIEVGSPETKEIYQTACEQYVWHGKKYTTSGQYEWKTTNDYGCEVTEILNLTILQPVKGEPTKKTICANSSIEWNGQIISSAGTYTATLTAANGCDSIATLIVTIEDEYREEQIVWLCYGETYSWRGKTLTKANTYHEKSPSPLGCDSTFILHLHFYPDYSNIQINRETCEDAPYLFGDEYLTQTGVYTKTFKSVTDCDSIVTLTLKVWPLEYDTIRASICQGEKYTFHGRQLAVSGKYQYVETNSHNCTKTTTLYLMVNPHTHRYDTIRICEQALPYTYAKKFVAHKEGDYLQILDEKNQYGCDSIYHLHLMVDETIITPLYVNWCENLGPYSHPDPNATEWQNLTESKVYRQVLHTINGCDSIIELHLTINDTTTTDTTYYLCAGDTYVDKDFSNITATQDTSYIKRLDRANSAGCDSVVYVTVKFGQTYVVSDPAVKLCEKDASYIWQTQDTYGQYNHVLSWSALNEFVLDTILYDTLHTVYPFYCDSVTSVHIVVNPTTVYEYEKVWCASAGPYSYGDHGKTASTTGTYIDTLSLKNHFGCDSVEIVHLEWLDSIYYYDTIVLCDNKAVEKHNILYMGDKYTSFGGVYDATLYDSVQIYTIGRHQDTITFLTSAGCDSTYFITIEVQPTHYSKQERNACQYEDTQYEAMYNGLGGKVKTDVLGDVVYIDTIPAIGNGCDSIIHMTYHIRPHYHFSQSEIVLCQAKDSMWVWHNDDGDPQDTISLSEGNKTYTLGTQYETIYGCDSTYGITVYIAPSYHYYDTITLCESDSAHWQNILFVGSEYQAYGKTYDIAGFDSIKSSLTDGNYSISVHYRTAVYDCDSVYHLHLTVNPVKRVVTERRQCQTDDGYFYENLDNGIGGYLSARYLSDSLTRNDTILTHLGCDSIITLKYYVDSVYHYGIEYTFCQDTVNNMREWIDEEGVSHGFVLDVSQPGDFKIDTSFTTIHGCDSTYGVVWHVKPTYRFDSIYTICEDETLTWQGKVYAGDSVQDLSIADRILSVGLHYDTARYKTIDGCDSTYYVQIRVNAIYDTTTYTYTCHTDSYIWRQSDANGSYQDVIWSAKQQDTIFISADEALQTQASRESFMLYHDTMLTSIHGCDSLSRLQLTIRPTYFFYTDTTICATGIVEYRGKIFEKTDTIYTEIYKTETYGCDSIYQLRLHVKPAYHIHRFRDICDNEILYFEDNGIDIVWQPGDPIPGSRDYFEFPNTTREGCDSTYFYHVTVHPTYYFESQATFCSDEMMLLHGAHYVGIDTIYDVYTAQKPIDTVFVDTLQTMQNGCDSIYCLRAHILPQYYHLDLDTICDDQSIVWRTQEFKQLTSGDYVYFDSLKTQAGCDSVYELRLHVAPAYFYEDRITKCADENLTWRHFNLDHVPVGSHFYYDSLKTIGYGCDSVYHLYLTVNDTTSEIIYDTICRTESYNLHGVHLYEPGYYVDTTLNEWECNHFTHLYLEVIEPTVPTAWVDSICADDNAYDLFYTYTGRDPIGYSVYYDAEGHYYGFEDIINEPIETEEQLSMLTLPMPLRDGDKTKYPKPNYYNIRLVLDNGICTDPDLCSTDTSIVLSYPSWITQQRFGDVIALYNEKYNGGYYWDEYQWYHGDTLLVGQTHEYLYIPTGLIVGDEYHVRLTRKGEVKDFQTCPITIVADPIVEDFAPTMGYLSVVPTCVCAGDPRAYILSRKDGWYRIITGNGLRKDQGVFRADVTPIELPNIPGIYMVYLYSPDTPEEPERCIKVLVSEQCPDYNMPF